MDCTYIDLVNNYSNYSIYWKLSLFIKNKNIDVNYHC